MKKLSILIVDDENAMLELLSDLFEDEFNVLSASDANEAMGILNKFDVHLIVSDIVMPGIDGLQFCSIVKTTSLFSHIPIILLTGKSGLEDKIAGLQNGADVYIEKPFWPGYLLAQVSSLLQNRLKIKEHFAQQPLSSITGTAFPQSGQQFLTRFHTLIEEHITNPLLDIEYLARCLHMSRTSLYRKIKAVSRLSPYEIIEKVRLKKAVALMQEGQYKINEIALMTGYSSAPQFSKSFKRKFGAAPLQYSKRKENDSVAV